MTTSQRPTPSRLWSLAADLACVLVLAIGGKSSHDPDGAAWVVLRIAWPFALAALVAHVVLLAGRRAAARPWPGGVLVLAVTYVGGMLLRAASGRGLDPAFLVVAGLVLTTTILGWRLLLPMLARLRK